MRPLAARFDVSATALYGHVASREALLGLMLDRVLSDVPPLDPVLQWDAALLVVAGAMREALTPYPQLALEALAGNATAPVMRSGQDDLVRRLETAGFDHRGAEAAVGCWGRWTLSYLAAAEHTPAGAQERTRCAFDLGLDLMLGGLRRQLAARAVA